MCRAIKTLYNFTPPVTDDEIRASSLPFVRKLSGTVILSWLALLVGVAGWSGRASAQSTLLGEVSASVSDGTCLTQSLASVTAVRPILRYRDLGVTIGHTSFAITGVGGTIDIDASNSPDFNNFATLLTDGINHAVVRGVEVDISDPTEDLLLETTEREMFPAFPSDLVGARITFVRLIVGSLDAGVLPCGGNQPPGSFLSADARFQFWGVPPLQLSLQATGCNPCSTGQLAAFTANATNPGPSISTEVKLTVTLPSGPPLDLLGGPVIGVIAPGQSAVPVASFVVPDGVPNGSYILEVALVDPARGITLARAPLRVVKQ